MSKKIRTIRPCSHHTKDCVGAHGNHLRNNTLQRHDKKAVRRRRFHGTILPSMSCTVHLLRRPHVRLDASGEGRENRRRGEKNRRAGEKGATVRWWRAQRKRGREGESYPRRSSGLKETINVLRTQWRTNGPLSGSVRAASVPAASLSVSSPPLDKIFSPPASRLACTKGA